MELYNGVIIKLCAITDIIYTSFVQFRECLLPLDVAWLRKTRLDAGTDVEVALIPDQVDLR